MTSLGDFKAHDNELRLLSGSGPYNEIEVRRDFIDALN